MLVLVLVMLGWGKGKGAGVDMLIDILIDTEGARARSMGLSCVRGHISVRIRILLGGVDED
jgi:hypothetical protein